MEKDFLGKLFQFKCYCFKRHFRLPLTTTLSRKKIEDGYAFFILDKKKTVNGIRICINTTVSQVCAFFAGTEQVSRRDKV